MKIKISSKISEIIESEEGLGFMESLVALLVAGIACVALMSVAIGVIREAKRNEVRDAMNQYAIEGLEIVRRIAAKDFSGGIPCPAGGVDEIYYLDTGRQTLLPGASPGVPSGEECSNTEGNGDTCEKLPLNQSEEYFYREIHLKQSGSCGKIRVVVEVGLMNPVSDVASKTNVVGYVAE